MHISLRKPLWALLHLQENTIFRRCPLHSVESEILVESQIHLDPRRVSLRVQLHLQDPWSLQV